MKSTLWSLLALAACGGGTKPVIDTPPSFEDELHVQTIHITVGDVVGASYAFQDGDGAWQLAPAPVAGVITLTIASPRYAVVRLCPNSRTARATYLAASETTPRLVCSSRPQTTNKLIGRVTSGADNSETVFHGDDVAFLGDSATSFDYEFSVVGDTNDFVAVRQVDGDAPNVIHIERDLAVSGTVTRDLNFNQLEKPVLTAQPLTATGSVYTFLVAGNTLAFYDDFVAPLSHAALAVNKRRATDHYLAGVTVNLTETSQVSADHITALPEPVTAPTANLLAPLDVSTTNGTTIAFSQVADAVGFGAFVSTDQPGFAVVVFSSPWRATFTGDMTWHVPDLAAVSGWPAMSGLRGNVTTATVSAGVETGTFPELGYQSTSYGQTFNAPAAALAVDPRSPDRVRLQRAATQARFAERVEAMRARE